MSSAKSGVRNKMIEKIKFFLDTEFNESLKNPIPKLSVEAKDLLISTVYDSSRSKADTGQVFEKALLTGEDLNFGDANFTDRMYGVEKFRTYIRKFVTILEVRQAMDDKLVDDNYVLSVTSLMKRAPIQKNVDILIDSFVNGKEQKEIALIHGDSQGNISRMINRFKQLEERILDVPSMFVGEQIDTDA